MTARLPACLKHPGFDIDMMAVADLVSLYQVWLGRMTFADVIRARGIELEGIPGLIRSFPKWFALSPTAATVCAAADLNPR